MPFFRYTATDSHGKSLAGTIEARAPDEAQRLLRQRGFGQVSLISDSRLPVPDAVLPAPQYVRTSRVPDRSLSTFFAQLASMIRAGINPFEAFEMIASRSSDVALRKIAHEVMSESREGAPISSVMERYVDAFPHNAVALTRAGEYGGFLPEALERLANHFAESAGFKKWFWVLKNLAWGGAIALACLIPAWSAFFDAFHNASTGPEVVSVFVRYFLVYSLPIIGAMLLIYFTAVGVLRMHRFTLRRHGAVLKFQFGIGDRAKIESLREFLWTLRNLSHAGLPFGSAWALAAGSCPNAEYASRLAEVGQRTGSEKPMSVAMAEAGLFPEDYTIMLTTGERTGDIVGMLDNILIDAEERYMSAVVAARFGLSRVGCLLMLLTMGAAVVYTAYRYYGRVFEEVDRWIESSLPIHWI